MSKTKTIISVRVSPECAEWIKKQADAQERSVAGYLRKKLSDEFKKERK